jgi:alpha-tubulin suppressor-like RCC1 family protein
LKRDGTVWAWGWNVVGQLGDGTTVDRHLPVHVILPGGITDIAAGGFHNLAIQSGGAPVAWGWNAYGQLGDGTTVDRHEFVPLSRPDWVHYEAISAGTYHSVAVRSEGGAVDAWGWNGYGQLGDGTTVERHTPVTVHAPQGFVSLSAGGLHTLARNDDGSVWAWGSNAVGQLGDGTTVDRLVPVVVPGLKAVDVSAGLFHSAAVTPAGVVMTWGWNVLGQLGTGTTLDRPRPTAVLGVPPAAVVAAGGIETMAR